VTKEKRGSTVITRQLPIPVAQLLASSAPGLQRPDKLLAELLFLLPEACNLRLQVCRNNPWSTKLTAGLHTAAKNIQLTSPLPILVSQPPIEVEEALFLSTHLGSHLLGFRSKLIHLRGQGLVFGHNALNLVEAPFYGTSPFSLPPVRRIHAELGTLYISVE